MSRKKQARSSPNPRPRRGYSEIPYWQSAAYNRQLYQTMLDECVALAMNRFEWVGLPPTCDARYLERTLLFEGRATLAAAPTDTTSGLRAKGSIYSLKVGGGSAINMYGVPTQWRAVGDNGTSFPVNGRTGAIVYDSQTRVPTYLRLVKYAHELADIYRTRQINRLHQKVPFLIETDQDHVNDAVNLYANMSGNEPATIVDRTFSDFTRLNVVQLGVPFLGEELDAQERTLWNRIYTSLGISNVPAKAERMIEEEVLSLQQSYKHQKKKEQGTKGPDVLYSIGLFKAFLSSPEAALETLEKRMSDIEASGNGFDEELERMRDILKEIIRTGENSKYKTLVAKLKDLRWAGRPGDERFVFRRADEPG